jgi:alkanesulfonate monooxygenase SsuD/methylene tetrahydromethanopterin reductase-like flavin-dependent oxidoreductase (luciferase family)
MQSLRLGVAFDFRNPPGSGLATPDLYARILAQAERVDGLGYDLIWLTEHHFVEDGYLPSFVPVAGALAARTRRVRISSDVVLMPFQHPLRLAEDLAVLDNLSGGRIELGLGMGYAPHEFAAFGIERRERVSRTEEGVAVLQRALAGEPFDFAGKHWQFRGACVRPRPVQPGGPPLWLAAMSEAGALRAARLGVNLLPQGDRRFALDPWRAAVTSAGGDPAQRRVGIIRPWLVTDDRARDWPAIREAERYKARMYASWIRESGDAVAFMSSAASAASARAARRSPRSRAESNSGLAARDSSAAESAHPSETATAIPQTWIVGDADAVFEQLAAFIARFGFTDVVTWAAPPGLAPEALDASLERFARDVMPRLKAKFA